MRQSQVTMTLRAKKKKSVCEGDPVYNLPTRRFCQVMTATFRHLDRDEIAVHVHTKNTLKLC